MNPLALITNSFMSLTEAEKRVASYILKHPAEAILSLLALAQRCQTSDATVLRFTRSLGYSGYLDFKSALAPELIRQGEAIHQELNWDDNFKNLTEKLVKNLTLDIKNTLTNLNEKVITQIVDDLAPAKNTVVLGLAGSAGVAQIFADSLVGMGKFCVYISDRAELERAVACLGPEDVVLGISHSGETAEIWAGLRRAQAQGAYTIALTNYSDSNLAQAAAALLLTVVPEDLLGSYSCQPRIAELAVLQLIVHHLAKRLSSTNI